MRKAMLAHSLIARVFEDGMNSSTSMPASGVKRTIDRMWSIDERSGLAILTLGDRQGRGKMRRGTIAPGWGLIEEMFRRLQVSLRVTVTIAALYLGWVFLNRYLDIGRPIARP